MYFHVYNFKFQMDISNIKKKNDIYLQNEQMCVFFSYCKNSMKKKTS